MTVMGIGMQQADGHGIGLFRLDVFSEMQQRQLSSSGINTSPLTARRSLMVKRKWRGTSGVARLMFEVIVVEALFVTLFDHVAEAFAW